jgi:endonuclease YncB( thermonuclease family)
MAWHVLTADNAKKVLTETAYKTLVTLIDQMLKEGKKASRDAESNLAQIYWQIGDKLLDAGVTGRNHYGESILDQLAGDLEINPQNIRRSIAFRRIYDRETLHRSIRQLTWSHFRILIRIHDDETRSYYENQVIKEDWSRDRLWTAIVGREYDREVLKKDEGPKLLKRPTDAAYVFKAVLLDIVDADTLTVDLDCGFAIKKEEKVRLASINAPEKETQKGKEALAYVRDRLAKARGIAIKTNKADSFRRYLGHVFYSFEDDKVGPIYTDGIYLNEELLKKGFAERM